MKNLIFSAVVAVIIISASSCQKGNSATSGGTWTFKSKTYDASFCSYIQGALTAQTGNSTPSGSLAFYFNDGISQATLIALIDAGIDTVTRPNYTFPPKQQSYIVTKSFPPDSGHVYVQLSDTSISNTYIISGSPTVSVTVTKGAKGFLTVTLPPVEMINYNNAYPPIGFKNYTDSSLVTGKIIQTQ